jgi:hypothetical protein
VRKAFTNRQHFVLAIVVIITHGSISILHLGQYAVQCSYLQGSHILDSKAKTLACVAYHRPMQRDPFVHDRSRGSISKTTFCVVLRDMLKTCLVLATIVWGCWRVLLEEGFTSHDGGKTEREIGPRMLRIVEIAKQCDADSVSKWRPLDLWRNVWRQNLMIGIDTNAGAFGGGKSGLSGWRMQQTRRLASENDRESIALRFQKPLNSNVLVQSPALHVCQ